MNPPILFDRYLNRKRRQRVAKTLIAQDFLLREAANRLLDAMDAIMYHFPRVLELGATSLLADQLARRDGTLNYIPCDTSTAFLTQGVVAEPDQLPFAPDSFDAVVSAGGLHWTNDLPGALVQIRQTLKPDGLFIATLPGPETLRELRQVFAETDSARLGGITPRIAPYIDVRDGGALLQRAGFALPVVDRDIITVTYENLAALMRDLRCSAQTNMLQQKRSQFTARGFFAEAEKRYREKFADAEGRLVACFECITMTAWKPAANQQQPAKRGSGQISLTQVLN